MNVKPITCTKGWPPKRRKEQAARCRRLKPWLHATGPRTRAGKAIVRYNALKHGLYSAPARAELREIRRFLRWQQECLRLVQERFLCEKQTNDFPDRHLPYIVNQHKSDNEPAKAHNSPV